MPRSVVRSLLLGIALSGFCVAGAESAQAATSPASSTPTPGPTVTVSPSFGGEGHLSPQQLKAQIAEAAKLRQGMRDSTAQIAAATTRLQRLAEQANGLLQKYAQARDDQQAAQAEADAQRARSSSMEIQLRAGRAQLGDWAFHAYAGGGSVAEAASMFNAMTKDAAQAGNSAGDLSYLTEQRVRAFQRIRELTEQQKRATAFAEVATTKAAAATQQAADARAALDGIIKQQRAELDSVRSLHSQQVAKAAPVTGLLLGNSSQDALTASLALQDALRKTGATVVDGVGTACSHDEAPYANGRIPGSGLCPLLAAPGESLRPAAAAAFNAMSAAYLRDTGKPLCVTDSYRSYAEQVVVKVQRGGWAATPGSSKHGLGLAVDLCGGVDSFGTAAHLWMLQNAPSYGWFHPGWAEPTGALPEPWHWEFAR